MEDDDVLHPGSCCVVLDSIINRTNNKSEHECSADAFMLPSAFPVLQLNHDAVSGHKCSIPGQPGTKFWVHKVSAI